MKLCLYRSALFCLAYLFLLCLIAKLRMQDGLYVCFYLCYCGCVVQEKPARPPCGITMPGCISMKTTQRESLPSLSRTSSTPCSLMHASQSCSGIQWKGGLLHFFPTVYLDQTNTSNNRQSSDTYWHLCASITTFYTADTDRCFLYLQETNDLLSEKICCFFLSLT